MISNIGAPKPPSQIMSALQKYGLSASGDLATDAAAIEAAMEQNGASSSEITTFQAQIEQMEQNKPQGMQQQQGGQSPQGGGGPAGGPPWQSLMTSLGLELQGSKEADMAAISATLSQMQSSAASSPEQQSNLSTLLAQFEQYNSQSSMMM